jgi:hypothetical protein
MKTMGVLQWTAVAALCLLLAAPAHAQTATTGQITGTVLDPQGGVVPGAQVIATNEAGLRREASTDADGVFRLGLLPPGVYKVEVSSTGFKNTLVEGVVVKITETTPVDVTLQVGAAAGETVTVTSETPLVHTDSATRGEVIESGTLRQLPLPTRNFQQLLTLTAGTVSSVPNSSDLGRGDTTFSVNGQRTLSNAVVINGVDGNSIGTGSTPNLAVPATDTLQEFIVQTSLYDASQGRSAGSIVAAVTKSGTNDFHGNAYYFLRNDTLNANNFFLNRAGVSKPEYSRHQYGFTLGGPVVKDRLWFFGSYQGTDEVNGTSLTHSIATVFVPGNLTDDRTTATLNGTLGASFGVAAIHPTALFLLQSTLPDGSFVIPSAPGGTTASPNTAVPTPVSGRSKFNEDQFNANADAQLTTNNRLTGKYFYATNPTKQALFNSFGIGNALPLPGFGANVDFTQHLLSIGNVHTFSTTLFNDARFGFSRITTMSVPEEPFTSAQVGIVSPLASLFPGMPTISVSNFFDVGASPFSDNDAKVDTWTVGDTVTWIRGKHTLKFGGEFKYHAVDLRFDLYTRGNVFHLGFSGNPFRDFIGGFFGLNGLSIMGSGVNNRANRSHDVSWFVNDDWRLHPRFTVNLGLRYEFFAPFTEKNGRYIAFDASRLATAAIPPVPGFMVSPGVAITGGFVQPSNARTPLLGIPEVRDSLVEPDWNNFGPRIGFAWQPLDSARFVVRSGYGIYFDRPNARLVNNQVLNFPYYTLAQVFTAPIATPFVTVPAPSAFPLDFTDPVVFPYGGSPAVLPAAVLASGAAPCAPSGFTCVGANGLYPDVDNFRMPYIQQYNLGLQYEFFCNWLLDIGYVGSVGHKLHRLQSLNQAVTAAGGPGLLSPGLSSLAAQGFGVHVVQSSANANYNSMQVSVTKRYSSGLQFLLAYTYGHAIDDYSGDASGTSDNSVVPGDQVNLNNRASSDFDRRHRLVYSYLYDFPKFYGGDSRAAKWLVNDWQIAGIITLQTGTPFSLLTNANAFTQARANQVAGCNPNIGGDVHARLGEYFETTCFTAASGVGNFGNTGRNILRGPDQRNVDFSVIKFFPVTEAARFEFRTEFFNLFNNVSFANPVNVRASANFGQIVRTSTGPRVVQFAFKFNW